MKYIDEGVDAVVFEFSDTEVVKFYGDRTFTEAVMHVQHTAARLGIGPRVGRLIKHQDYGWGFTVERLVPIGTMVYKHDPKWEIVDYYEEFITSLKEVKQLLRKVVAAGFSINDYHVCQLGVRPSTNEILYLDFADNV